MGMYFNFFNAHDKLLEEEKAHEEQTQPQGQLDFIGDNVEDMDTPEPIRETNVATSQPIDNKENENTNENAFEGDKSENAQKGELANGNQSDLRASE